MSYYTDHWNKCPNKFKDILCGYSGKETSCDGTLKRCRELNNAERYGGFPGLAPGCLARQQHEVDEWKVILSNLVNGAEIGTLPTGWPLIISPSYRVPKQIIIDILQNEIEKLQKRILMRK